MGRAERQLGAKAAIKASELASARRTVQSKNLSAPFEGCAFLILNSDRFRAFWQNAYRRAALGAL